MFDLQILHTNACTAMAGIIRKIRAIIPCHVAKGQNSNTRGMIIAKTSTVFITFFIQSHSFIKFKIGLTDHIMDTTNYQYAKCVGSRREQAPALRRPMRSDFQLSTGAGVPAASPGGVLPQGIEISMISGGDHPIMCSCRRHRAVTEDCARLSLHASNRRSRLLASRRNAGGGTPISTPVRATSRSQRLAVPLPPQCAHYTHLPPGGRDRRCRARAPNSRMKTAADSLVCGCTGCRKTIGHREPVRRLVWRSPQY